MPTVNKIPKDSSRHKLSMGFVGALTRSKGQTQARPWLEKLDMYCGLLLGSTELATNPRPPRRLPRHVQAQTKGEGMRSSHKGRAGVAWGLRTLSAPSFPRKTRQCQAQQQVTAARCPLPALAPRRLSRPRGALRSSPEHAQQAADWSVHSGPPSQAVTRATLPKERQGQETPERLCL